MSVILLPQRRIWTSQPQVAALPADGYDSIAVPEGKLLRALAGSAFTNFGDAYLSSAIEKFGRATKNTLNNYFYRVRPWALSGRRTWSFVLKCDTATTQGIWSVASSDVSGSPYFLLQRNTTDVRLYAPGSGYVITFSGVATSGAVLNIALGFSNLTSGSGGTAYLAINGVIQSASYAGGTNAATNEYLFSGYSAQFVGSIGGYASAPRCDPSEIKSLSENPWQTFQPQDDYIFIDTGAGGAVTHSTTGALTGSGSSIAGAAAHVAVHATTGTLAGQGSSIAGVSSRTRAHPSSGAITGAGSNVSGSADHIVPGSEHFTSGALSGQGSALSGVANHVSVHATSGALAGGNAIIVGSASRTGAVVSHATSGILTGAGASIVGAASIPGATTLTAADLAAIAAIVQGIIDAGVNVTKLNGATLYGSGISSDKWRGTA